MNFISDFHIHSRFSRGCSINTNLAKLEEHARMKGIGLLGTGDFTHPVWFKEISEQLAEDDNNDGVMRSKDGFPFILTSELSLIYSQDGKGRRVHHVLLAPSKEVVGQIHESLLKKGRLDYDGRPIFGFSSPELVEMMRSISDKIEIIPAHIWTPWFAIFGSNSGFDSVEECFGEKSKYIHALETGMSSDPAMNWRLSKLDKYNLVSFSDSHSFKPHRLGREATVFELEKLSYSNIIKAIKNNDDLKARNRIDFTIETDPAYGKYHFDGHRACGIVLEPKDSLIQNGICPVCKKKLTLGVAYRIEQLADRPEGYVRKNAIGFKKLIPLQELIAAIYGSSVESKKVLMEYARMLQTFGSENEILLNTDYESLVKIVDPKLTQLILLSREGRLQINPGYDGVYGQVVIEGGRESRKVKIKMEEVKEKADKNSNINNPKNNPPKKVQLSLGDFKK